MKFYSFCCCDFKLYLIFLLQNSISDTVSNYSDFQMLEYLNTLSVVFKYLGSTLCLKERIPPNHQR